MSARGRRCTGVGDKSAACGARGRALGFRRSPRERAHRVAPAARRRSTRRARCVRPDLRPHEHRGQGPWWRYEVPHWAWSPLGLLPKGRRYRTPPVARNGPRRTRLGCAQSESFRLRRRRRRRGVSTPRPAPWRAISPPRAFAAMHRRRAHCEACSTRPRLSFCTRTRFARSYSCRV